MIALFRRRHASFRAIRREGGFSLIEVLVALLILAIGLLGLAFLQVINVRYTTSAQHRTMATNLAGEVLDMMRSNPRHVVVYNRLTPGYFAGYAVPGAGCDSLGEAASDALSNVARWRCNVVSQLPGGSGNVVIAGNPAVGYTATVTISWADDVGQVDDAGNPNQPQQTTSFQVTSLL